MKIGNSVGKSLPTSAVGEGQVRSDRAEEARSQPAPAAAGESVQLSPLSVQLQAAESAMANTPVVDVARVEEIKQAISEGRFKVNSEVVADRLLETAKDLIRSRKG